MSLPDAKKAAVTLHNRGFDIAAIRTPTGRSTWIATHPDHPDKPIRWSTTASLKRIRRQAGDLIGDPILAGRTANRSGASAARRAQREASASYALSLARSAVAVVDVIDRRRLRGPEPLSAKDALAARSWTLAEHALMRASERAADPGNIMRAIERPDRIKRLSPERELRATATCKVVLDPVKRRVITVV